MLFEEERRRMIETQLEPRGIHDPRVLEAMSRLPRELFVPEDQIHLAYSDSPLSIGDDQTISQPYIVALMAQLLELQGWETVLEIGAGSGYHAALLGNLARRVYAIEVIPSLAALARANLDRSGVAPNVSIVCSDGSKGYPECMPYDAISVAAGAPEVPRALLHQLADPGRLVIPVGSRKDQDLLVVTKSNGRIHSRVATFCRFVPLIGREGWRS